MLEELKEGARQNPIWFGAVATITGVQGFFAWEFWGAVSTDPMHQLALRALGLGFVAGEVVALDMASRADLAEEPKRANTLRSLWFALAVTTFAADINALSRVLRDGDEVRASAAAAYDARQSELRDLERRIEAADDPYAENLLTVTAYDAAIRGKQREIASALTDGAPGSQRRRLDAELTELQTARATAAEVDTWEARRTELLAMPATHAERPETHATEFEPFADLATGLVQSAERSMGRPARTEITPEDVRASMAWIATIAMKLMLTFGIWVGLQRSRAPQPKRREAEQETKEAANTTPAPTPGAPLPPEAPKPAPPLPLPATQRPAPRRAAQRPVVFGRGGARFPR